MAILVGVSEAEKTNPVVRVAYELAVARDEHLFVLHVITEEAAVSRVDSVKAVGEFPGQTFVQEADSAARYAEAILGVALPEYEFDRVDAIGRVGDPAMELFDAAHELEATYLVIGTSAPAEKPEEDAPGSVTRTILANAELPVITVHDA